MTDMTKQKLVDRLARLKSEGEDIGALLDYSTMYRMKDVLPRMNGKGGRNKP